MASLLTATSFQGRLYYIGLLLIFSALVFFLLFFKEPGIQQDLERRAFRLNYAAFKNSVRLYNYRYLLQNAQKPAQTVEINGLVFNSHGFPVGEYQPGVAQLLPASPTDCQEIWRRVLGPLQPSVSLTVAKNSYWTELTSENHCLFHSGQVNDLIIDYDAVKGLVSLIAINR